MIWIVCFFLNYTTKNYMNTVAISVILKQASFSLPHNLQNSNSIKHYMMVHYCYQFWIIHLHFSFYWKIKCAKEKVEEKKKSAWEGGLCKLRLKKKKLHGAIYCIQAFSLETAIAQNYHEHSPKYTEVFRYKKRHHTRMKDNIPWQLIF